MIGIATLLYDTNGDLLFFESPESSLEDTVPRVTRTATLDGGCVITHSGFSNSDRTFEIDAFLEEPEVIKVRNIYENHSVVYIATVLGLFKGALSRFKNINGAVKLTVLVEEKITN